MNSRFIRPALAALIGGALVAGGAVHASPAFAEEPTPVATDSESPSPAPSVTESETTPATATPAPSVTESETTPASPTPTPSEASPTPSTPPSPSPSPSVTPPKDAKGPNKANFKLNYSSVWLGQVVTFTQTTADLNDPTDSPASLARIVDWGDGVKTTLTPSTSTFRKTYTRKGTFKVTVTVTDPAGNRLVTPAKSVAVTVPTGTVTLSKKTAYQGAPFNFNIKKVPAGATSFRIDWSDGWPSSHKAKNGSVVTGAVLYQWKWDAALKQYVRVNGTKITGKRTFKISWYNAKGYSVNQTVGTINFLKDSWKPTLTITKPSASNKAGSWKTIRGTATDKGAGITHVYMTVQRVTATGKWYCLTPAKKWKRVYTVNQVDAYCFSPGVKVKIVKGKWSVKLPAGITKNQLIGIDAYTIDYADNLRHKYREAEITRS